MPFCGFLNLRAHPTVCCQEHGGLRGCKLCAADCMVGCRKEEASSLEKEDSIGRSTLFGICLIRQHFYSGGRWSKGQCHMPSSIARSYRQIPTIVHMLPTRQRNERLQRKGLPALDGGGLPSLHPPPAAAPKAVFIAPDAKVHDVGYLIPTRKNTRKLALFQQGKIVKTSCVFELGKGR